MQNIYIDKRKEFSRGIYDNEKNIPEESIITKKNLSEGSTMMKRILQKDRQEIYDDGEFITTRDLRKEFFGDIYNSLNE